MYFQYMPDYGTLDVGVKIAGVSLHKPDPVVDWLGVRSYSWIQNMINSSFIRVKNVNAHTFYNGTIHPDTHQQKWIGDKPVQRDYDPIRDYGNYSNPVASLLSLSNLLGPHPFGQNQVRHLRSSGEVRPSRDEFYTYHSGSVPYSDFPNWRIADALSSSFNGYRYYATGLSGGLPTGMASFETGDFYTFTEELSALLLGLKDYQNYASAVPYIGLQSVLGLPTPDVRVISIPDAYPHMYADAVDEVGPLSISFRNYNTNLFGYGSTIRRVKCKLDFRLLPSGDSLSPSVQGNKMFNIEVTSHMTHSYYWAQPGSFVDDLAHRLKIYEKDYTETYVVSPFNFPLTVIATSTNDSLGSRFSLLINRVRSKDRAIQENFELLRPSSMFSFSDAISNMRATDANYVEVLAEGRELFRLFPTLIGITKAFFSRDFSSAKSVVFGIGDLLSSSTLLYRFGLKPTASNASDIILMSRRVGAAIKALQSPATYHGKFVYSTNESPLGAFGLVTRTTARINGASDDFIIKALELDALGLLPLSSNLWDVVPWSWFIDYFTNLAGRFSVIDSVLLGLIRGVTYSVHSYTIYDTLQSELPGLGWSSDDLLVEHYYREVSRFIPAISHSTIDFGDTRHPDSAITGAILWQLARGATRDFSGS